LKSDFTTISLKWSPYWDDVSRETFVSLPWRSRSQHDFAAKSCPAHNFVILSLILHLFHKNDHHIETTCPALHLARYLEGQAFSITLQRNRLQPITSLFEFGFYNNFTEMITILRRRIAQCFGCIYTLNFVCDITLTLQEVYFPVSKTYSGSITRFRQLLF
jgi:hypothetical protein